jgi:hypothetical protein
MNTRGRFLAGGVLFLTLFTHSYIWGDNKIIHKSGENPRKEQLRKEQGNSEELITRIQGEVRKSLQDKKRLHLIKPGLTRIDPDFSCRAPKDEKVLFTQAVDLEKKTLKTKLNIQLGETRKVTQITKEISCDKWKVRYSYDAQKKLHSFKGDAEVAGFDAHVVLQSKQKPAFSAKRPIEISKSIKIVPSGNCDLENKNFGLGLTGSMNKSLAAAVYISRSPGVSIWGYSFKGSLQDIVEVRLQGKTVCRPDDPQAGRATHKGTLVKKLGDHVSVLAGFQYENAAVTNPSISFIFSKKF